MRKNVLLSLILISFSLFVVGQSQRLVLVEEATNASCAPCAAQNPAFDALLQANLDKLVAIKYHWYFPGYDPMHNHNVDENNFRVSYYGINGVPHGLFDGTSLTGGSYVGAPANATQAKINAAYAVPSPFEISISHEINDGVIDVAMLIQATDNVSGNLRAHLVVVEKFIDFASPPGGNGEHDFHDVMKKMLPNAEGTTLQSSFEVGEYIIIQESWELANVYDMDELGVVGFVQDKNSKEVHQAGDSSTTPFTPLYANDADVVEILNVSANNCLGSVIPKLKLRNNGSDVLTSANITYQVNGGNSISYAWTGNLEFLESEIITLEESDFSMLGSNSLTIEVENINGLEDDYMGNNVSTINFDIADDVNSPVKLVLVLDENPEQTNWELANSNGDILYSGGNYTTAGDLVIENFNLNQTDCYLFTIYDTGGDGLIGDGVYVLAHNGTTIFYENSDFGFTEDAQFKVSYTGVDEISSISNLNVYPNPVSDIANIAFDLRGSESINLNVYNALGEVVYNISNTSFSEGFHTLEINTSQFTDGIYYINLNYGEINYQEKIIVTK